MSTRSKPWLPHQLRPGPLSRSARGRWQRGLGRTDTDGGLVGTSRPQPVLGRQVGLGVTSPRARANGSRSKMILPEVMRPLRTWYSSAAGALATARVAVS